MNAGAGTSITPHDNRCGTQVNTYTQILQVAVAVLLVVTGPVMIAVTGSVAVEVTGTIATPLSRSTILSKGLSLLKSTGVIGQYYIYIGQTVSGDYSPGSQKCCGISQGTICHSTGTVYTTGIRLLEGWPTGRVTDMGSSSVG